MSSNHLSYKVRLLSACTCIFPRKVSQNHTIMPFKHIRLIDNWGKPERAPQNGSIHVFDCSQKITLRIRRPSTGSVVVQFDHPTVPKNLHFKCGFSDQHGEIVCVTMLIVQRERKLEQRDLGEEESSTGLENKEKCGNATELARGQALATCGS